MAYIHRHGGYCCGVRHLSGFTGLETTSRIKQHIKEETRQGRVRGQLVEAILTDSQCRRNEGRLPKALQEVGFRLVARFTNINSGNNCNVFHYNKFAKPLDNKAVPFEVVED